MTIKDPNQARRLDRQLAYFRAYPDREIRTGELKRLNAAWGFGSKRSTAKRDLRAHERRGHVIGHGPVERRRYRLAPAKTTAA